MQNSHGLMEDGSPIPPHLKENGSGLFPGIFPPLGPPPHELLGLGGNNSPGGNGGPPTSIALGGNGPNDATKEHYFSRLLGEQSEMSKEKMERQQKMLQQQQKEGAGAGGGHTCSLCGDAFPEIVALQVHIIKSHGAFPPDSNLFGNLEASRIPGPPGSNERPSMEGSPENSEKAAPLEDRANNSDGRSEGEVTPNKAPSTPALGGGPGSVGGGMPAPTSTPPSSGTGGPVDLINKNFSPHIEMLQRHMLSQQFPGLINPLLSGFPGFPGGPPPLAFPNPLQQLLAGSGNTAGAGGGPVGLPTGSPSPGSNLNANGNSGGQGVGTNSLSSDLRAAVEAGQLLHAPEGLEGQRPVNSSSSTGAPTGGSKKRRFKCSKCQVKFKKREDCLRHIHAQHSSASASSRRKLQFTSPKHSSAKAVRNNRVRSHYVKRLMEILRVPTSRGTPSSVSNHIMQAFLIKSQQEMEAADEASRDNDCFVPSMVYLPVARKINQPMTVAFNLTPA